MSLEVSIEKRLDGFPLSARFRVSGGVTGLRLTAAVFVGYDRAVIARVEPERQLVAGAFERQQPALGKHVKAYARA